ncbi:MAG: hypothetical protein K8T91_20025 [Planctomycetes bacterium]|nr:hypothetical protein [Planctomycetota bacterium]
MVDGEKETTSGIAEYAKEKQRQGYSSVKAVDPHDGKQWDVLISGKTIARAAGSGSGCAKELAYTVRCALLDIRHLYRGVRDIDRQIDEDKWLCYIATPSHAYDYKTGEQVPAWRNEVFLVYVTDERVVYTWGWVTADPNNPHIPEDCDTRFREKVF